MIINTKFHQVMAKKQAEPFVWGTNDCALFCADVYGELYGKDFAEGIRGTYNDAYHGYRKIVELGGWDGILLSRGFVKLDNLNYITRGDVVVAQKALGIWVGTYGVFAGGKHLLKDQITDAYHYKEEV